MADRYRNIKRKSFFHKIFWVYLGITISTGLIMLTAINRNLTSIKYDQAMIMSDQILTMVDTYLTSKMEEAVSFHQSLYRRKEIWNSIMDRLEETENGSLYSYQQQELNQAMINMLYGVDKEFNGIFMGNYRDGTVYQYGLNQAAEEKIYFQEQMQKGRQGEDMPYLAAARNGKRQGNAFSLFLFADIKSRDFSRNIGCMGIYFSAMNIRRCYEEYEKYLKGNIYIFDQDGGLIFDSKGEYELPDAFLAERVLSEKEGRIKDRNWIYNIMCSRKYGYYIVHAYPVSGIREDVQAPRRTMLLVSLLALIVAVALNYISIQFFAKRLEPITDMIEQVKMGKLTSFPIGKRYDDELGYIYAELLRMCVSLDDHIQKEYVYRLRQKEMELYALQTQIDPHFLYNTLEAIRMKLYVKGEDEASKMIFMLSGLFRNMMKKDAVVTNREELAYLDSYMQLFALRLGERMRFSFDIQEEVYRYATVKHILQPVVENALVHGVSDNRTSDDPCTIRITARKEESDILFTISDDGCGIPRQKLEQIRERLKSGELFGESIGIYNVNNRLRIVYGCGYQLQIDSKEEEGTLVRVRIKAMKKRELESYVQTIDRG